MMVGYKDFVNFGRVDDPDDWMPGVRIRPDGIYMDEPPRSPIEAGAGERAALTGGHPTGNLHEPVIKFPCDLSELAKVLVDIGAAGRIDAFDMADWLIAEAHAGTRWPWGSHETELLRHMVAAANRFWRHARDGGFYDPSDPSTAPKSVDVEMFLQDRGLSAHAASAIARVLRADDLRTGPR